MARHTRDAIDQHIAYCRAEDKEQREDAGGAQIRGDHRHVELKEHVRAVDAHELIPGLQHAERIATHDDQLQEAADGSSPLGRLGPSITFEDHGVAQGDQEHQRDVVKAPIDGCDGIFEEHTEPGHMQERLAHDRPMPGAPRYRIWVKFGLACAETYDICLFCG